MNAKQWYQRRYMGAAKKQAFASTVSYCTAQTQNHCILSVTASETMLRETNAMFSYRYKHLVVQFLLAALFIGLAFRFLFFGSPGFNPDLETPLIQRSEELLSPQPPSASSSLNVSEAKDQILRPLASLGIPENQDQEAKAPAGDDVAKPPVAEDLNADRCDLFAGDWIPDPSGPFYTNESCSLIEGHQNCMRNGRPDTGYLYWRWNPRNCQLPRFNPQRFLDMMRDKRWAFIGDSISRNHVQSLLCMLSTVEQAVEVYHDKEYKSKRWHFPTHNFSVSVIWSPFLVEAAIFEDDNGVSSAEAELQLDKLDKKWTDLYQNMDYVIISSGKWFYKSAIYHENNTALGCHNCAKRNLTELGFDFAYRKALRSALTFIVTTKHEGLVLFRTSTPEHFESGEWHNGGNCPRTAPFKDGEIEMKDLHHYLRDVELSEFESASIEAAENGVDLRLLDLMKLSLLRPDGHPGPYRQFQPFAKDKNATLQNDCLHWCLPGPIDSWNDVIMEMMFSD